MKLALDLWGRSDHILYTGSSNMAHLVQAKETEMTKQNRFFGDGGTAI